MHCDLSREAVSARLDGEALPPGLDGAALDAHLVGCADCRAWEASALVLHRQARLQPAPLVADRTEAILAAVPASARPRRVREGVRYALLAVGLTQIVLALPALLTGEATGMSLHMAREMAAFELAVGVGLVSVAWRPRLAGGLLPFALAFAAAIVLSTALDLVGGGTGTGAEAHHVLDLVGVGLLAAVEVRPRRHHHGTSHGHGALPAA
jgi:predicted anti-sigma-YlaC factor YlaD